ncbi:MAG: hypothetical protein WC627_03395 [Legionella sp.]
MMRDKNMFRTFSVTTAAIAGIPTAAVSGLGNGVQLSGLAAQKASQVLFDNSGQRDSLLRALQALFVAPEHMDNSVLDTFMDEIKGGLVATNDSVAFIIRNALLGVYSGVSHASQIPLDASVVAEESGKGLSNSQIPFNQLQEASQKAFKFDVAQKKSSPASVEAVSDAVAKVADGVTEKVDKKLNKADNSHAKTHARTANSTGVGASVLATAAIPTGAALLTDTIGHIFREGQAISHFSHQESASKADEKNLYHASSGVFKATQASDSVASEPAWKAVEIALSHTKPAEELLSGHSVSAPSTTALVRLVVLSLVVEMSRGLNKTAIMTTNGQILKALAKATEQGASAGVDRINSLHSNLSSLSNIMRLCAENMGGFSAIKTVVKTSELVSSRSITVLLSNVGELAQALRPLVNPDPLASTIDSAKPGVLQQSAAVIKEVLDRIERENEQPVIPGLNQDMAIQLSGATQMSISGLLATHSIFSNPVTLATKGVKAATQINEAQRNEALMETLPALTQALNAIQASTRNFMDNMKVHMAGDLRRDGSLLSTHHFADSMTATVFWSVSAVSLFADEMISVCRSLSLIDKARLKLVFEKASEVRSKDESAQASEQMAWDSHLEQENSATHAITALRLSLSHTGMALMRIALDLEKAVRNNLDTEKRDLAMHTLQRSLLASCATGSLSLVDGVLLSVGAVSAFPVSLKDSANGSHACAHSTDAHIHPQQTHDSEQSSKDCSPSTQVLGFSTDLIAGTITNVLKVLAQGSLIGLDTTIQLIKILEIISLHRDSHIALRLETKVSSNPNGLTNNTLHVPSAGATVGTSAVLVNLLEAFQTMDRSCGSQTTLNAQNKLVDVIDKHIESVAVLDDEEEISNNKLGLKEFYKIIICLLAPNQEEVFYDSLVRRLNFGGIALSNYHSMFNAYETRPADDAQFVSQFGNDDDAQGILRRFIDKAKRDYSLLKNLHLALPEEASSHKAKAMYEIVFEEVFQQYKQIKMRDVAQHGSLRRKIPTVESFEIDAGLRVDGEAINTTPLLN